MDLLEELRAYRPARAAEEATRLRFIAFLETHADAFRRELGIGHITASAWIVDRSRTRALLVHHRKLGRWLQPGGHVDGERDVRAAALREAREETGLTSLSALGGGIYDLDIHTIPARGAEPVHEHFDVRFAYEADPREAPVANGESHGLAWVPLNELAGYDADESVLRLGHKVQGLPRG